MPVAAWVLGTLRVFQAMMVRANAPTRPESQRSARNDHPSVEGQEDWLSATANPTASTTARKHIAPAISTTSRSSGSSTIVGEFKYQWPRNMAAIVNPNTSPLV